ncbi:hybrid sensor histidine kinase/response regulator [Bradyrhizobium sp. MOS003]|uniref:hybrid sensor histidine kinase/response regulator n=1 Tax=Bradyrhizobium sp. MOS003 TaxID=2133946 RepID=UPI000D130417|nr:hybrid sensor histidine kinase/response regulator [Bradyrhizobium sp. MOS003]PSO14042.1 hybrid sensor histidine kinase/response regulator [Bradyrhizobium sp. MOS003]
MKQRKDAALRWLWFSLAASIIAPALVFAYAAYSAYQDAFELADERIERSLEVSAEQALRVFRSINVTLDSIDQITRGKTDSTIKDSGAELSERLKQFAHTFPDISSIWVLDHNGDAILSSLFFPVPAAFNAPERAHLKAELAQNDEAYIGRVVGISLTGAILFPVSKRRHDSSGTFNGYTLISVLPSAFENLYATLRGTSSASFALIRDDGAVLARHPIAARPGIVLDPSSGFGQLIKSSPEGGRYTTVSNVDGLERRFAVRKLVGLPVYVSSSMETSEIRSTWLRQLGGYLAIGAPALALVCFFIVLTARSTAAFYAEAERRETLEQEMRRSQRIEAVGQLTGGIAHDFNNLLTIIIGNLQMASRRVTDEKPRALLENAQRGALRAAELTKRLLAFSRKQALDPKPVHLNRLVRSLTDMLARTLGETISIETNLAPDLGEAQADVTELESAVLNLALNARDAMPNGGTLILETANASLDEQFSASSGQLNSTQYVSVSVKDTGIGMAPEVADKAFEPFFTTKPPGMGTGLGLSQVYGFVKQSDGDVRISSAPGAGTTVTIFLPRRTDVSEPARKEQTIGGVPRGHGERVLVTEDDEGVRQFVAGTLVELGYEVMQAQDGDAALNVLATSQVDLLLTDVVMPGMNGRDLAAEAQRRRPGLKVLYMTGYSRDAIVHQGRLDRGVSLIQKPFTQSDLAGRVRSVLTAVETREGRPT